jgi:hypothetical protein
MKLPCTPGVIASNFDAETFRSSRASVTLSPKALLPNSQLKSSSFLRISSSTSPRTTTSEMANRSPGLGTRNASDVRGPQ